MVRKLIYLGLIVATAVGAALATEPATSGKPKSDSLVLPGETHLSNIRQITFGGQNAEAYWNREGTELIFQ